MERTGYKHKQSQSAAAPTPENRMTNIASPESAQSSRRRLAVVAILSLFCTFVANRVAGYLLPQVVGIGPSCLLAALVACAIYLSIRPEHPFGLWGEKVRWRSVIKLSVAWLMAWFAAQIVYAKIIGAWVPYVTGIGPVIGFLLFGPIAEEFLFRGAIFELSQRLVFHRELGPQSSLRPIWISTFLFSAYHLQIHGYHVRPFVILQMVFVIPLGYVLARVRGLTGSVWPGLLLHIITNIPNALGPY